MNKQLEQIKAEIERRKAIASAMLFPGQAQLCEGLLDFINSLPEDEPSEDLEKAADNYVGYPYELGEDISTTIRRNSFKAGAKWDREQMMKDAEPAEVGYFNQIGLSILTEKSISRIPLEEGDKVKLIIVKEDKL